MVKVYKEKRTKGTAVRPLLRIDRKVWALFCGEYPNSDERSRVITACILKMLD